MFLASYTQTALSEVRQQNESLPAKQMECRATMGCPLMPVRGSGMVILNGQ